jgi:hypothetical protein
VRWDPKDRETFRDRVLEYWPPSGKPDRIDGQLSLYCSVLEGYPLAVVLSALRELKMREDVNRLPTIKRVGEVAAEIAVARGAKRSSGKSGGTIERLAEVAANGNAYWTSPRGVRCRVRAFSNPSGGTGCLEVLDVFGKVSGALPFSSLGAADLERVLAEYALEENRDWFLQNSPEPDPIPAAPEPPGGEVTAEFLDELGRSLDPSEVLGESGSGPDPAAGAAVGASGGGQGPLGPDPSTGEPSGVPEPLPEPPRPLPEVAPPEPFREQRVEAPPSAEGRRGPARSPDALPPSEEYPF